MFSLLKIALFLNLFFKMLKKKKDGSVRGTPLGQIGPDGHGPLSFHCKEREVDVAL